MSTFKAIRERLGFTQSAMGELLDCSQGNISFYERGQTVPPPTAERLIAVAAERGLALTFDHVYGRTALPEAVETKA